MEANCQSVCQRFLAASDDAVSQELRRIGHCLDQLSEEQVWTRPAEAVNSIGTIIVHLCGNLRQWFLHGLGGEPDVRNRSAEFAAAERIPKELLLELLSGLIDRIRGLLKTLDEKALLEPLRIQGCDVDGLSAIYWTITHLEGHALQIAYITHMLLGERYEPFWKPASHEQGAAPCP